MKEKRNYDLGRDRLMPLCFKLGIPTALAQAVMVLYAIIDRMFIGHIAEVGELALAGVGVAAPITTLISSFAVLIGLGGSPIMAMRLGQGEKKKAEDTVTVSFVMLCILSLVLTPLFFVLREFLLSAFGASGETLPYAKEYLGWYILGTPFVVLANGMNYFLINQGQSRKAMVTVLSGAALNIILDPIFIFWLGLDVKGAAIATILSQALQMGLTLFFLRSHDIDLRLEFRQPSYPGYIARKIVKFGSSPFIIISTDSVLMIVLNTMLQKYGGADTGDMLITCSTIIQSFHLLLMNPLGGITGGCQGMISFNYGAGNRERVKKGILTVQFYATLYTVLMTLAAFFTAPLFARLFTTDEQVIAETVKYLRVFECMVIPLSLQYNNVDCFTAMGKVKFSLPLSIMRKSMFLIALLICPPLMGAPSAFLAEPISDLLSAIVSTTLMWTMIDKILLDREKTGLNI